MCAGYPLHASLILNTGSKLGQKEVFILNHGEDMPFFCGIWWQARQNSAYICTTTKI